METTIKLPEGFTDQPGSLVYLQAAVDLFNACALQEIGVESFTKGDIGGEWEGPGLDPETDQRLVFSPDGKLAGYIETWTNHQIPVHPWVWGCVHPDFQGLGIGSFLLAFAETRCRKIFDRVPLEARVAFRCGTLSSHQPGTDLLEGYGMQLIRHNFQMRIDLTEAPPAPVWPEGIQLRRYRPEDLYAIYLAGSEAFEDHFGHVPEDPQIGFEKFKHFRVDHNEAFDPDLWVIAMDGDQIAGISLGNKFAWEDRQMGWVNSLGVRRPWRRRGLGLALLLQNFSDYWQRGYPRVGLGVDAQNLTGALNLYKKAGMHVFRQFDLYEKELRPGIELARTHADD